MLKLICDKCGCDCGLNAYVITTEVIHNPTPTSYRDFGDVKITDTNLKMKIMFCQECYEKLNFPNIYTVENKGQQELDEWKEISK